jgi:2-polyprenyl-3-methyl-5-hydroxy-6-metoxy-1,4-benzoquinol methylase
VQETERLYDKDYFTERNAYLSSDAAFTALFEELVDEVRAFKSGGALLDVGCGPGLLLEVAIRRGYEASGCDVSEWAVRHAREAGLDVRHGDLESQRYRSEQFEVVIINHTLEHLPRPLAVLREAHRVLARDGVLVVGVPNVASLMARIMRHRWAGLLPDQHLWHFTPRTLRLMLSRGGFVTVRLIAQPAKHHHPNPFKRLALNSIGAVANSLRRGEALLAIAKKSDRPPET